jgi:hypothetical protein
VSRPQNGLEFVDWDSDHQIVPDDPAAHSTVTEKGEAAEHLSFGELGAVAQGGCGSQAVRRTP